MAVEVSLITKAAVAAMVERALGRWFLGSPARRAQMRPLAGRVIAVQIDPPGLTVYLIPDPEGLQVQTESSGRPDTTVSGSLPALLRLGLGHSAHQAMAAGDIRIDGNPDVATALRALFSDASREWRDRWSEALGPVIGGHLASGAAAVKAWTDRTAATIRADVAEFLQEETRELPAPAEGDAFLSDVDRLREGCDRLEARLARLRAETTPTPQG
jgi:ubiquinone biosynthesis protein UbiJ